MPLASLFNLQWYGPASASAIDTVTTSTPDADGGAQINANSFNAADSTAQEVHGAEGRYGVSNDTVTTSGLEMQGGTNARGNILGKVAELSAEEIAGTAANAVWKAKASEFNAAGTMGNKLNGAGSAGNPWTDPDGIDVHTRTTELWRIHGLKAGEPMTVTPTSRAAGDINQTISGDGTTTTTVTRD